MERHGEHDRRDANPERVDGDVGDRAVARRHPALVDLVDHRIHQRDSRAAEQGVAADAVGKVYAQQIIQNAPAGTWFLDPSGGWRQK